MSNAFYVNVSSSKFSEMTVAHLFIALWKIKGSIVALENTCFQKQTSLDECTNCVIESKQVVHISRLNSR